MAKIKSSCVLTKVKNLAIKWQYIYFMGGSS
jgi:hypothetical protein